MENGPRGHAFRCACSQTFRMRSFCSSSVDSVTGKYIVPSVSKSLPIAMASRLRSYIGYPPVRDTLPNTTHFALAALQYSQNVMNLITQNVDGLHHKAIKHAWGSSMMQDGILELHGTLHVRPVFVAPDVAFILYKRRCFAESTLQVWTWV